MKISAIMFLLSVSGIAFAGQMFVPQFPEASFADTEVSTNVVIEPLTGSRKFIVELSLYATPTNNVEVSVGRGDAGNYLPFESTAFSVGWDCGSWFFASPSRTNRCEASGSDVDCIRSLFLQIDIRENDSIRDITLSEGGTPVFASALNATEPSVEVWNQLKATTRGLAAHSESITVKTNPHGLKMIFR